MELAEQQPCAVETTLFDQSFKAYVRFINSWSPDTLETSTDKHDAVEKNNTPKAQICKGTTLFYFKGFIFKFIFVLFSPQDT